MIMVIAEVLHSGLGLAAVGKDALCRAIRKRKRTAGGREGDTGEKALHLDALFMFINFFYNYSD
jgi:hypothetical protein